MQQEFHELTVKEPAQSRTPGQTIRDLSAQRF